uniref:Uncharacterized protein n=1 Tax=viral metagenome TaxID=1070528 RepID=A0A6M3KKN8_9ZZZZ
MESEQAVFSNMSIEELTAFKEMYKTNEAIVKIMEGYIEGKRREEAQAKAKADFTQSIADMVSTLVHPDGIHNVYLAWREVEIQDTDSPEEVEVIKVDEAGNPVLSEKGKPVKVKETRYPMTKVWKWIPELNKGFQAGKAGTTTVTKTTNKRAVTLSKREGDRLVLVGHFPTASRAVEYLKLPLGGDSATRVLQREGMFIEPYGGTDYTLA